MKANLAELIEVSQETAKKITTLLQDGKSNDFLPEVDQISKAVACLAEACVFGDNHIAGIKRVVERFNDPNFDVDNTNWTALFQQARDEEAKKPSNAQKGKEHVEKTVNTLRRACWNVHHKGMPMPGVREDDELVDIGGDEGLSLECPITGLTFVQPVMNPACGHTYSKEAILNSMQIKARDAAARGGRAAAGAFDHEGMRVADVKCPVRGCNKTVTAPSLQDNLAIAARLRRLERAAAAGGGGGGGGAGAAAGAGAGAGSGAAAAGGAGGSKGSKRSKPAASTGEEEEGEEGAEGATSNNQQNKRARSSGAKSKKQEGEEEEDNGEEGGEDDDDFGEDLTQHPARRG